MRNFVWILDAQLFPFIKGNGGVSASYVLPKAQAPANIEALAGATLWVVMRDGDGDFLFARLYVKMIEQFEDGYNKDDFLLTVNQAKSCRIVPDTDWSEELPVTETRTSGKGIFEPQQEIADALGVRLRTGISINFRKPSEALLGRIVSPSTEHDEIDVAERWISAVSSQFSLKEIWGTKTPSLAPFAHFAYLGIEKFYGHEKALSFVRALNSLDPTSVEPNPREKRPSDRASPVKGLVDTNLVPIDVNTLYARKFVAQETTAIDMKEVLEKVERAEKRHQDMLRDISSHLISLGYVPLQSSSIDLSVETEKGMIVCELKSSTPDNAFSQSAKGSFQLFCYRAAFAEKGKNISNIVLVLEKAVDAPLEKYINSVLSQVGIITLFYDATKEWPDKLLGLASLLKEDKQ